MTSSLLKADATGALLEASDAVGVELVDVPTAQALRARAVTTAARDKNGRRAFFMVQSIHFELRNRGVTARRQARFLNSTNAQHVEVGPMNWQADGMEGELGDIFGVSNALYQGATL